jgi:hypothetical protein
MLMTVIEGRIIHLMLGDQIKDDKLYKTWA